MSTTTYDPANRSAYDRLHYEVKRQRGSARDHDCVGCGGTAAEWSSVTGKYATVDEFEPLCISCHRRRDKRRDHDAREDHAYDEGRSGCAVCRRRREAARRATVAADPVLRERRAAYMREWYQRRKSA